MSSTGSTLRCAAICATVGLPETGLFTTYMLS